MRSLPKETSHFSGGRSSDHVKGELRFRQVSNRLLEFVSVDDVISNDDGGSVGLHLFN